MSIFGGKTIEEANQRDHIYYELETFLIDQEHPISELMYIISKVLKDNNK